MKIGANDISAVKIGATDVNKVYLGANLVWEKVSPLLLDLYPNAAAAYSLRKLSTAYTGAAIEVRKTVAGVTSIQDIGFVDNELDTASLLSFAGSDDVFVAKWYDQSGEGNNATNTSESLQPKIVSLGSVILENGKPAISFDGIDDRLSYAASLNIGGSPSIIMLLKTSANKIVWQASGSDYWYIQASQLFRYRNGDFDQSFLNSDNLPIITDVQKLIATYKNSNNVLLTVDGSDVTNKTSGTGADGLFNNIGGIGLNLNGVLQEVIIYQSDQSANRAGIETNINNHYTIY